MPITKIELTPSHFQSNIHLITALSHAFFLNPVNDLKIIIHFPNDGKFIHSEKLLIISSLISHIRFKHKFVDVVINGENAFASRINFYKILGISNKEKFIRRSSAGKFIELQNFNKDTIYGIQDELNMILYQNRGIDNILVHSGSNDGWVSAQYFPKSHEISLIICDNGEGIHQSLTTETKYKGVSEPEALNLCIKRGVTNGKGLGFGLFATSEFILKNQGDLTIYSGKHYLNNLNGVYEIKEGAFWKGTLVCLRINTNFPVNYKDIMPSHHTLPDDYNFFIQKYFGEDNELW
jgi:hypothetical protein